MDAAGLPPGVFNLIQGTGVDAGAALAAHPDVDMISFTGSTRGGIEVARAAAASIKRVAQELGGKSPNIIVDGDAANYSAAVKACVELMMTNSGQSCSAPSRLLVPRARMPEACAAAAEAVKVLTVGDPTTEVRPGPVVSRAQFEKVQGSYPIGHRRRGATPAAGGQGGLEVWISVTSCDRPCSAMSPMICASRKKKSSVRSWSDYSVRLDRGCNPDSERHGVRGSPHMFMRPICRPRENCAPVACRPSLLNGASFESRPRSADTSSQRKWA